MANKIGGIDSRPVRGGSERQVERTDARAASGPPAAGASSVSITDAALRLAALERAVAAVPEVDVARVAELRAAIESGKYQADAQRIAARLLDLERELESAAHPARPAP